MKILVMCHQQNHQLKLEIIKFISTEITELTEHIHKSELST